MESYGGHVVLDKYFEIQKVKIGKNQKVEYYDGNKSEYIDLMKLATALLKNETDQYIRDFSVRLFNDSKRGLKKLSPE